MTSCCEPLRERRAKRQELDFEAVWEGETDGIGYPSPDKGKPVQIPARKTGTSELIFGKWKEFSMRTTVKTNSEKDLSAGSSL